MACAALLMLGASASAEVFKSVDKDGRVIYSDKPSADAAPVPLGRTNTLPGVETGNAPRDNSVVSGAPYSGVAILDPADGATVTNPGGNFSVQFEIMPALRDGDTVQLLLDGQPAGSLSGTSIQLEGVLRGEHTLELLIIDPDGRFVARADLVSITLIRPNPNPF
jgi:hypothetical protein